MPKFSSEEQKAGIGCLAVLVCAPVLTCWRGWVMQNLWVWFVTPVFGLPVPTLPILLGLSIFVGLFHPGDVTKKKDDRADAWETVVNYLGAGLLFPAIALVFGWVIHLFAN